MANSGCGPTACADIIVNNPKYVNITPKNTRDYMVNNGYAIKGAGTAWAGITACLKHYGFKVTNHPTMDGVWKEMAKPNRKGIVLFRAGTRGGVTWTTCGHFLAFSAYKVKNGKHYLYMRDPGTRRHDGWYCYEDHMKGLIPQIWTCYVPEEPKPKPKTKIEKFCDELIREEPIIMSKMKYSNSDSECHTFDDALKYGKCNCAKYISYALQESELLPKGITFYWHHTKTIRPAKALQYFLDHPNEWQITYPNRVMKPSELQVGDICGWHTTSSQHTTAICGKDKDGNFIWASGGSADMKNGMVKVRPNFDKHVVNVLIRYIGE